MTVKQFMFDLLNQKEDDEIVFKIRDSNKRTCFSFESAKVYKRTKGETIIEIQLPNEIKVVD